MDTPDLTFYRLIHRGLRSGTERLADAISELDEVSRTDRAHHLATWYTGFAGELHEHHTVEDDVFFPSLFERVPALRGYLGRIDGEHARLDEVLDDMRDALTRLADPSQPFDESATSATALAVELRALLDGHLDFEDAEILPLFERHYDAESYDALEGQAIKGSGKPDLGQLAWTIPWVIGEASSDERKHVLDKAPLAMKLLWLLTRRRYARLEAAAFGTAAVQPVTTVVA